jgi:hypothetical protein
MDAPAPTPRGTAFWVRTAAYWLCTGIIAQEMVAGAFWDFLQIEFVRGVFAHIGYPLYLLKITGIWKIPCAVVLVLPRFLRLKEWAYAGAVFLYTGAAASHFLAGDGPDRWAGPLVFSMITLASWVLRPASRRLVQEAPAVTPAPRVWAICGGVLVALTVIALVSIPKGPTPP